MPDLQTNINQAYEDLVARFPRHYRVKAGLYLKATLLALAQGDGYVETVFEQVRANLRATTGQGKYQDAISSKFGVTRALDSGIGDQDFANLVPLVGPSPKQILSTLQQILNQAYGPYITAANLTANLAEPYSLTAGSDLYFQVDAQTQIRIEFSASDATNLSSALASELASAITTKSNGAVLGSVATDHDTGLNYLNCRTATIGNQGFLQVIGGDSQSTFGFGILRETTQGIGTWSVTNYGTADQMLFTLTGGTDPGFAAARVIPGDMVTIRSASGFSPKNTGSFPIVAVGVGFFIITNNAGVVETITQAHANDLTFFNPSTANILLQPRVATITEDSPNNLTCTLPVTSPIARRNPQTAWYLRGAYGAVLSATSSTITLMNSSQFTQTGVIRPTYSRRYAANPIAGVGATTITLDSTSGFPTQGAIYSDVTQQYYYYSGISGDVLQNVQPTPPGSLVGSNATYSDRYLYTGNSSNQLTGVFPNPSGLAGFEVMQAMSQLSQQSLGSYIYDLTAAYQTYAQSTTLSATVNQGDFLTILKVSDCSAFPPSGYLIFEGNTNNEEGPIQYLSQISSQALQIAPKNPFGLTHLAGTIVRLVSLGAYQPRLDNSDYPIWLTSSAPIRDQIEGYMLQDIAAGVFTLFDIVAPTLPWPIPNQIFAAGPIDTVLL